MNVDHEVTLLIKEIQRLGEKDSTGRYVVKFGVLALDDHCAQIFEAIVGTLKAAKKKKVVDFKAEILLHPTHKDVDIVLLKDSL
ncbi:hypothetical protein HK099_003142 [Clydaea vesicula]|uniref:Costars domain-containing protein n=1 Tax=Clydaea vesicula TaxID=447962 RepID=A0AAD5XYV0_9FUNG|nr:hypothetical protein HK099_003142 [Clydaea vesicula]KAJ3395831.1 hypothetical protein HDU92_004844 [Lobulomyces angularis]